MKSFRQFMEQPEIVNMMKNFAQQNEKSPQELKGMRDKVCLLYTSPSPRDTDKSRMPSSA